MYIAADDIFGVLDDRFGVVCKYNLGLGALLADHGFVVFHVINAGEGMFDIAEETAVIFKAEDVGVGVHAAVVERVLVKEMVADLVGGVGQHEYDLFAAARDAAQAYCKAVAGKDREHNADGAAAELGLDVGRDIVNAGVVAVCARNNGFGDGNDVALAQLEAVLGHRGHDGIRDYLNYIVALTHDGG